MLNVVWLLIAGIWIFISHLVLGVGLALTVIGIPFAFQHLKFGMLALAPFGKRSSGSRPSQRVGASRSGSSDGPAAS